MPKIHANDLEQLLTLIEEETSSEKILRDRLKTKIADKHLHLPKRVLQESIAVTGILATPRRGNLGKMIVLTGLDKSGKETQAFNPDKNPRITSVYDYLLSRSHRVLKILLPSYDTTFGSIIAAYLGKENSSVQIIGELPKEVAWILWSLDRAQHVPEIERWLSTDPFNVVLSKRWTETNLVYQRTNGIEHERILKLERNVIKQTHTFVIDVSLEVVFKRMRASGENPDKYETRELLKKVHENYIHLKKYYPFGQMFHFDGSGSLEEVNQKLLQELGKLGF